MPRLEDGQRFERYRIVRRLGNGIAGESYEAEDIRLQRKVTLKLIHPWSTLPDSARRQFFREMQGISFITHPYMAATLDYGEVDGQLYIARRYVGPGSLLSNDGRSWFSPPLNVATAIHFTHQLAQALQQIHNYGYLHGSLTLPNILVLRGQALDDETEFAPLLLSDAGMAHFVRRFGHPQIKFLPTTAAPEQIGKRTTAASDQYALAVILYFWLAGNPPFLGSPEETERAKLAENFPRLSTLNAKVTSKQDEVLRQALRASPEERYPSIIAFAEALLASLSRPTYIVSPPEATTQPAATSESAIETLQKLVIITKTDVESNVARESSFIPTLDKVYTAEQQPSPPTQPEPEPAPQRGPIPQTVPDVPLPIPEPEPTPIPQPEPPLPRPEPEPKPAPEPQPEIIPPPAPDIPQPIPEPAPTPPDEPAKDTESQLTGQEAEQIISASLIITSPYTEEPREVILEREETTIGRAGSSDIFLDWDTQTSRHQALLVHQDDHYILYDLRSAYGTSVNGQKLTSDIGYELSDGDSITIGVYNLVFHLKTTRNAVTTHSQSALSQI